MNPNRIARIRLFSRFTLLAAALVGVGLPVTTRANLTASPDKRAVQWSTNIVQAKLVSLGDKIDLPLPSGAPAKRPSGRPTPTGYRVVTFQVGESIDGSLAAGDTVTALILLGGQPGDGIGPALLKESVGRKFILFLRPLTQTSIDAADGTNIVAGKGTQVIVAQLGEADMNSETVPDLKKFVSTTHDEAAAVKADQIAAQADTLASAQDSTEADHAEKALEEIGPAALPALEQRLQTANSAGKTRLKHVIDDLNPPALSAEPE